MFKKNKKNALERAFAGVVAVTAASCIVLSQSAADPIVLDTDSLDSVTAAGSITSITSLHDSITSQLYRSFIYTFPILDSNSDSTHMASGDSELTASVFNIWDSPHRRTEISDEASDSVDNGQVSETVSVSANGAMAYATSFASGENARVAVAVRVSIPSAGY